MLRMAYKYQPIKDEIFVSDTEDNGEEEENSTDIADEFEVCMSYHRILEPPLRFQLSFYVSSGV